VCGDSPGAAVAGKATGFASLPSRDSTSTSYSGLRPAPPGCTPAIESPPRKHTPVLQLIFSENVEFSPDSHIHGSNRNRNHQEAEGCGEGLKLPRLIKLAQLFQADTCSDCRSATALPDVKCRCFAARPRTGRTHSVLMLHAHVTVYASRREWNWLIWISSKSHNNLHAFADSRLHPAGPP
jgi:hypothetical protein